MWIIEDVQATIMKKIDSLGSLGSLGSLKEEKNPPPERLTLTIEVSGRKRVWIIDVENTTTVIMLKNILRKRNITHRLLDEINIFFNSKKLLNDYWYLRDYDVESFSTLKVVHRKVSRIQKLPTGPMILKMKDTERKELVMQRLHSRRLEDVFHFIMLHALYDPNSNESSYLLSEVAELGAFKRPTDRFDKEDRKTSSEFSFCDFPNGNISKDAARHGYK